VSFFPRREQFPLFFFFVVDLFLPLGPLPKKFRLGGTLSCTTAFSLRLPFFDRGRRVKRPFLPITFVIRRTVRPALLPWASSFFRSDYLLGGQVNSLLLTRRSPFSSFSATDEERTRQLVCGDREPGLSLLGMVFLTRTAHSGAFSGGFFLISPASLSRPIAPPGSPSSRISLVIDSWLLRENKNFTDSSLRA